jgi:hypothetical protein
MTMTATATTTSPSSTATNATRALSKAEADGRAAALTLAQHTRRLGELRAQRRARLISAGSATDAADSLTVLEREIAAAEIARERAQLAQERAAADAERARERIAAEAEAVAAYDALAARADAVFAEIAARIGGLHVCCREYTALRQQAHRAGLRLGATSGPEPEIAGPIVRELIALRDAVPCWPLGPVGYTDTPLRRAVIGLGGAREIKPPALPEQVVAQIARGQ